MTTFDRFERNMPALLDELAAARRPDYFDDILSLTERTSQRPGWTFPERWLPMSAITERMATAPRFPVRMVAVALIVLALIVGAAFIVGNQPKKLPAPFGPATNGLVAYSSGGDIYTADPVTGVAIAIVTGPEQDRNPVFSRDGTQVAFRRQIESSMEFDLVVARADGSEARVVTTDPISYQDPIDWSADGGSLFVLTEDERILRLDATRAAEPTVVAERVDGELPITGSRMVRPPDGSQVLYRPRDSAELWVVNADGSDPTRLVGEEVATPDDGNFDHFAWSPDGQQIAFSLRPADGDLGLLIFVINADGTGLRQVTDEPGVWVESDLAWSPDGNRIAFNRWRQNTTSTGGWDIQPIGVVSIDGGPVRGVGPVPVSDGAVFEWSPDGSTIVSLPGPVYDGIPNAPGAAPVFIDVVTGTSQELGGTFESATSWQRVAPTEP